MARITWAIFQAMIIAGSGKKRLDETDYLLKYKRESPIASQSDYQDKVARVFGAMNYAMSLR